MIAYYALGLMVLPDWERREMPKAIIEIVRDYVVLDPEERFKDIS